MAHLGASGKKRKFSKLAETDFFLRKIAFAIHVVHTDFERILVTPSISCYAKADQPTDSDITCQFREWTISSGNIPKEMLKYTDGI